jgi:hypothetical protein
MGFETIAYNSIPQPRPAPNYPIPGGRQGETEEPQVPSQPANTPKPTPTTPSAGAAKPRSDVADVGTAISDMRSKADVKLKSMLGDGYVQPATHYDYVVRCAEVMKTLKTPAQRANFKTDMEVIGAPLGINFGLSREGPGGARPKPLNEAAFKALDAQSKARQANDALAIEYTAGKKAAATQKPTTPTSTQPATPTPAAAAQKEGIKSGLAKIANGEGTIGVAEVENGNLADADKASLKRILENNGNKSMTVDELTDKFVEQLAGTPSGNTGASTQPDPTKAKTAPNNSAGNGTDASLAEKVRAVLTPIANEKGNIGVDEVTNSGLSADKKTALMKVLENNGNKSMTVDEMTEALVPSSTATPEQNNAKPVPGVDAKPTTPTTTATPTQPAKEEFAVWRSRPGITNKSEATYEYLVPYDKNKDGLIDVSELEATTMSSAAKAYLATTILKNGPVKISELMAQLQQLGGANEPATKPRQKADA